MNAHGKNEVCQTKERQGFRAINQGFETVEIQKQHVWGVKFWLYQFIFTYCGSFSSHFRNLAKMSGLQKS